jgi:glycosyltransferase involved in cell wall biosynthesis
MLAFPDPLAHVCFRRRENATTDSMTTPPSPLRLSVVLMTYNEVASVEAVAREIQDELARLGATYELLVVDDGSSDGSDAIADRLVQTLPCTRVVHHQGNRGLGAVYRTGFAEARGELLTFFPADGQFPATIIGQYLGAIDDTDMILGTLPQRRDAILGRVLSFAERLLLRALFGQFPRFQGIVMFRRELLTGMTLASRGRGWTVLMELILRAQRNGVRMKNLPITLRPRASGTSKVNNLRNIVSNLQQVLELRLHL